jgi:hypothetical protein
MSRRGIVRLDPPDHWSRNPMSAIRCAEIFVEIAMKFFIRRMRAVATGND